MIQSISAEEKIQRVTVKAIIENKSQILMVRDQKRSWELPGGKVEFGEHPIDALKRELAEELDAQKINIKRVFNVWDFIVELPQAHYQFIVLVFICDIDFLSIKLSGEHNTYRWMTINDITLEPMREGYRKSILEYLKAME